MSWQIGGMAKLIQLSVAPQFGLAKQTAPQAAAPSTGQTVDTCT